MARKKIQDVILKQEDLDAKYGNTKVGAIKLFPEINDLIGKGKFIPHRQSYVTYLKGTRSITSTLNLAIHSNMEYLPRCKVELDETFLQPINYVVLKYRDSENSGWKYFCTKRIGGGEARLTGLYAIGIGGHVDGGEDLVDSMYRELAEEVGLVQDDITYYERLGYIYDQSTAVGRVHLGLVVVMKLQNNKITVKEKDKLTGEWVTLDTLRGYAKEGKLESWSEIILDKLEYEGF